MDLILQVFWRLVFIAFRIYAIRSIERLMPIITKKAYLYTISDQNVEVAYVFAKKVTTNIRNAISVAENLVDLSGVAFFNMLQQVVMIILK